MRLLGVAGEYQADGTRMSDQLQSPQEAQGVDAADDVVTTAIEEEIITAEIRRVQRVGT